MSRTVPAFSSARAALRMLAIARLPSWHSYGTISSSSLSVRGIAKVQGRVHVVGSASVTRHSSRSGATRVKRSVIVSTSGFAPR